MATYILDNKPVNVVSKPWYLGWISEEGSAMTIGGTVYINTIGEVCLLNHEFTHVRQQRKYSGGMNAWLLKYIANSSFRKSQEFEAYTVQAHEIGIKFGKTSFQYTDFLRQLPSTTGYSQSAVNSEMITLWEKYPTSYIVAIQLN